MKSVATLLIQHLRQFGVSHVFGIPGKAISPLVLEAERQGMKYVLCRHEGGAGFAAAGFAYGRGPLGVAFGTSGPGGTNLLTAAGQAKAYNLPVLFITGHPSMKNTGKALGQDSSLFGTDLVKMFEPVTLWSACIERSDLFQTYFQHALEKALGAIKGPVHLGISYDILLEEIPEFELSLPGRLPEVSPTIDQIVSLVEDAHSPVILLGKGVHLAKAYEEVMKLAEKRRIPVMTTPGGKGSFPTNHPLSLGGFGLAASPEAYEYLRNGSDLLIVLGTKLSDMSLAGVTPQLYPERIIQFDCDPTFVGKSLPIPTIGVIGDLKRNLQELLEKVSNIEPDADFIPQKMSVAATNETITPPGLISAAETMRVLRKGLPEDVMVISDDGSHSFYAIKHFEIFQSGTFLFDDVFGAMGHAIGLAIGYKLAQPDRKVACFTGDGCFMMHGAEVSTAVCNQLSIIYVVLNNGRLDMVEKGMKTAFSLEKAVGVVYETPMDAAGFGRSLGAAAYRCRTEAEIASALDFALTNNGPTVIEVLVDPAEIPPTLNRG